ncbi:MAG TPA: PAS domain S-box protein [Anaeromyxobacteraceae bacterium]
MTGDLQRTAGDASRARAATHRSDLPSEDAALFRLIVDQSTDYIAVYDGEARLRFASRSVTALFGYDPDAIRGTHALDYVCAEDEPAVAAALAGVATGRSQLVEFRLRCADGALRWVEAAGRPFFEGGRMDGFLIMIRDIHDRRVAERAQHVDGAAAISSDGHLELGPDGDVTAVDGRVLELFGCDPAVVDRVTCAPPESVGEALLEATAAKVADRTSFLSGLALQQALPDGVSFDEFALLDGRVLERYGAPRRGANGAVVGRTMFLRDVTVRRRAEVELRERARQQETVAELGEIAMNAEDPQPLLTLAARLVASTLGLDLVQVLEASPAGDELTIRAGNLEGAVLPDRRVGRRGSLAGLVLDQQTPVVVSELATDPRFDSPVLRDMGIVSSAVVVVRGRDRPFGVLGAHARRHRAFTEDEIHFLETVANVIAAMVARHAAEATLLSRERQLRAIFENALDALCTFDEAGHLVEVNPAACRLFGRGRAELLGRPVGQVLGPRSRAKTVAWAQELRRRGHVSGEVDVAPPGLPPRQVEFSAVAGILPGLHLGVMRDVTEQRAMQSRLALADRMASVGTLAAGVAHELNNPLSYVIANVSWVTEGLAEATARPEDAAARADMLQALEEARGGAERMRDIIRDLRTFSRGDETRSGAVELAPVLESCVSMAWNEIRHRARLVRELLPVPAVHGNEARLGQVFLNLIVNAAQSIREGAAEKNEIRLATRHWHDGRIAVEVTDTGSGIAPDHRARIFDPFFTTKPLGVGTGLGLSICHNLVAALGGTIEVESELGKGSRFRVLLRRWEGPAVEPVAPACEAAAPRRGRVLVVDDEPLVGAAVRRALAGDHEVTVVSRAREALARLDAGEAFDLVVTDLLMPDMTGIDLARELEARAPELAARTVFVTGGAFTPASRAFVEAHREAVLDKPFELERLRELVRRRMPPPASGE